jgi:hypothetical protein
MAQRLRAGPPQEGAPKRCVKKSLNLKQQSRAATVTYDIVVIV